MDDIFCVFIVVTIILAIIATAYEASYCLSKVEIENYTTTCEITKIGYDPTIIGGEPCYPFYKMGVQCDDFTTILGITEAEFVQYEIGDKVEMQVIVYEYRDGKQTTVYNLLGVVK